MPVELDVRLCREASRSLGAANTPATAETVRMKEAKETMMLIVSRMKMDDFCVLFSRSEAPCYYTSLSPHASTKTKVWNILIVNCLNLTPFEAMLWRLGSSSYLLAQINLKQGEVITRIRPY